MRSLRSRISVPVSAPALLGLLALLAAAGTGCAVDPTTEEAHEETTPEDTGEVSSALPREGTENPTLERCLGDATGTFTATPASVPLGASSTLEWNVKIPSNCPTVRVHFGQTQVAATGTQVVRPQANSSYGVRLSIGGYGTRELATANVTVQLPPRVDITQNDRVALFNQAIQTANTTVVIANDVQLDLSGREHIYVAPNVTIQGGRRGREPGPRIFTNTRPRGLFVINEGAPNVRITGVRIEGPDMGAADRNGARAILVKSGLNVEIDHDEISGWALAGVHVWDEAGTMASPSPSAAVLPAHTVNIHDNFIHHNQAVGGDGYGVAVGYGAHPMIARNVFDWNRHAIEGDAKAGTGYSAYYNLVLENGGLHRWIPFPGLWVHTHQFDMHGLNDCGLSEANCGPAGHTMLIRHNTFFYHEDNAIKLRGTPAVGMFVGDNVFANHSGWDDATDQTEIGLVREPGNVYGYDGSDQLGSCDLDGDGVDDSFMATGQSWWYRSGTTGPWEFLNGSTKKLSEITLGFFDGDNRCDVSADGTVFPGGKPAVWRPTLPGRQ